VNVLVEDVLIYRIVLIFMIGLILFYQVIVTLCMDFWPKFTCTLETIEWTFERRHLVVGLLD